MQLISDFHIHGSFSRATSKDLNIENLEKWARIKGVNLLGTGDFQHPEWSKELNKLDERSGILYTKTGFPFVWQTEISLMYSQGGRGRRVHYVILAPEKAVAKQITEFLGKRGRLDYDGRPIFGFSSIELVEELMQISKDIEIIPAHVWTPYFGIFGSKSGFDTLEEAFQEKSKYIHAIETGISSDPEMNWHLSQLNDRAIVSFSDLHSFWPWRLGREATIFKIDPKNIKYNDIIKQIRENSFASTVETDPAYGKYHWDGHENCNFSCSPEETAKLKGICPVCKKPLTIGVEFRVKQLTDQPIERNRNRKPYYKLLPLHELISVSIASSMSSKKSWSIYNQLIEKFSSEFNILLNAKKEDIIKIIPSQEKLADLILANRSGNICVKPGYDGVYGKLVIDNKEFSPDSENNSKPNKTTPPQKNSQKSLGEF